MADTTIKLSGTYDSIEAYELLEEMRGVASDYLPLGTIHSVTVTENAIVFEANFGETQYYNGYIFYEGEGNPLPYQIGYRKTGVDDYEANYIAEDDLYLYGKEDNETPTFTPWYLVKPVGENWYYYEYHTDAQ